MTYNNSEVNMICILDIEKYNQQIINGNLVLKKIIPEKVPPVVIPTGTFFKHNNRCPLDNSKYKYITLCDYKKAPVISISNTKYWNNAQKVSGGTTTNRYIHSINNIYFEKNNNKEYKLLGLFIRNELLSVEDKDFPEDVKEWCGKCFRIPESSFKLKILGALRQLKQRMGPLHQKFSISTKRTPTDIFDFVNSPVIPVVSSSGTTGSVGSTLNYWNNSQKIKDTDDQYVHRSNKIWFSKNKDSYIFIGLLINKELIEKEDLYFKNEPHLLNQIINWVEQCFTVVPVVPQIKVN